MENTQGLGIPRRKKRYELLLGISMTFMIALAAKYIATLPFLAMMGQLVLAMMIGIAWRAIAGLPAHALEGIHFSSKRLLRLGIILLGMRLNLSDIVQAGPKVALVAITVVVFTFAAVYGAAHVWKLDQRLAVLTACGTAICGAAVVAAIAPLIKAKDNETAIGAAIVAILGTLFTLLYTLLYPYIGLTLQEYGFFTGATLHEIAHVIAAAASAGDHAVDIAVIVKLMRVALLIPAAMLIGIWQRQLQRKKDNSTERSSLPIPWFILGFLAVSGVHSLGIIPQAAADQLVLLAYLFIAMAMAGLGFNVDLSAFRRIGLRALLAGAIGSLLQSGLGYGMIYLLYVL